MQITPITSRTDPRRQTYRWLLLPRRDRWPRRRRDWLPLGLVLLLVAGLLTVAGWKGPWLLDRTGCRPGLLPSGDVWSADGECVGLTGGSYFFERPEFAGALATIERQNAAAAGDSCRTGTRPVTVGVLATLTSPRVGSRAVHELEGFAAAQAQANRPGCIYPIRLRVGQLGGNEQAAAAVAERLAADPDVVAAVGMGLSDQRSANAVTALAGHGVPMVSDVITAEGFDQSGSADDRASFAACDPGATYAHGVGQGFFYRVAFRVGAQIEQLYQYSQRARIGRLDYVLTPTTTGDPYTCTALPLLHRRFGPGVQEIRFDPADPTTVTQSAKRICDGGKQVTVFYTARARDLPRFLATLQQQFDDGQCTATAITVLSTSDAERLRAPELDPSLERLRQDALRAPVLRSGRLRVVYTPLADSDLLTAQRSDRFAALRQEFLDAAFDPADLDDGWGINAHDALTTVAAAVSRISVGQPVSRGSVNTTIGGFSGAGHSIVGAGGDIAFDNAGNRVGRPVVVRLCPVPATRPAVRPPTKTALVYPRTGRCS